MAQSVKITFKASPALREFLDTRWTAENSRDLMQIVENELSLSNFPDIWRQMQGQWIPLTKEYQRWKTLHYPGRDKWQLTGATVESLFRPVSLSPSGGVEGAKSIALSRSGETIRAEYMFRRPAAGGYFDKNNRMREIWRLLPLHRAEIVRQGYQYLKRLTRKAGFRSGR